MHAAPSGNQVLPEEGNECFFKRHTMGVDAKDIN